jgi:hypothetical protein
MGALREQLLDKEGGGGVERGGKGAGGVTMRHVQDALQVVRPAAARGAFDVFAAGA